MLATICRCTFGCFALIVLLLALLVGAFMQGIPTKLGLWKYVAKNHGSDALVGAYPATLSPEEWRFTFDDLAALDLTGQTALVTGANSGVGYWTARHLAQQGARVILACRTPEKCDDAVAKIKANTTSGMAESMKLDTSSLASVRSFADAVKVNVSSLDMLVLNAGIVTTPKNVYEETADGIEVVWATNHVGHFLLFKLLLPLMESGGHTGASRVAVVSSCGHYEATSLPLSSEELKQSYSAGFGENMKGGIYFKTKLANLLFGQEASRRLAGKPVYVNVAQPGFVDTGIWDDVAKAWTGIGLVMEPLFRKFQQEFMWTGAEGALTQTWLVASPKIVEQEIRGRYFHPQAIEVKPSDLAYNETLQRALWDWTEALVAPFAT